MSLSTTEHGIVSFGLMDLSVRECGDCGVIWAVTKHFLNQRQRDHRTWYCPNGHEWYYPGESDIEKAKREAREAREALARERARHDQTLASLRSTKGVVTKQRKRLEKVVAGVCPVDGCKRHFRDLRRHIATKHPDYRGQA